MSDPHDRKGVSRREFVGRLLTAGAVGAAAGAVTWTFAGREPRGHEGVRTLADHRIAGTAGRMTIAAGSDPARNVRGALEGIGGIAAFVRKGEVVLVKPNVGWDRVPDQAANTNPAVVAELVRMAYEAGAREVIVADISCNDPARSFARSGIEEAARKAGAGAGAGASADTTAGASSQAKADDVIDAEFEEKK